MRSASMRWLAAAAPGAHAATTTAATATTPDVAARAQAQAHMVNGRRFDRDANPGAAVCVRCPNAPAARS